MIGIVTILLALPLGYLLRSWLAANLTYAVVYLWAFVFQTLYLLLPSIDGTTGQTFDPRAFPLSYGLVTAAIFAVGFGLVALGHVLRRRRPRGSALAAP
jgi:hypothetical protein